MKICLFDGCDNPVYSHSFCKWHQSMRTDDKKPKQRVFATNKRRSTKRNTNVPLGENNGLKTTLTTKQQLMFSFGFTSQREMFEHIWLTRVHVCQLSGIDLESVPQWQHHWKFAHILPKKNYPLWRLNPENILLIHPSVHSCVDNFTEDMRKKHEYNFDLWFNLVNFMKQKYLEFLKENMI